MFFVHDRSGARLMSIDIPQDLEVLKTRIASEHPHLSKRLKQVSHYVMDNPTSIALDTLSVIAGAAGVHASTLVRFANNFGFAGFSDLQKLYKTRLMEESSDYNQRIRSRMSEQDGAGRPGALQLLTEFGKANLHSLEGMLHGANEEILQRAIKLLTSANTTYLVGVRRAFPIATYLHYTLSHINRRSQLLDGTGGMLYEQGQFMGPDDALIAISYKPYGREARDLIGQAAANGCPVIIMTDSQLYPAAVSADALFVIKEAEVRGIRSLSSTMCLAQALCIGLAYEFVESEQVMA